MNDKERRNAFRFLAERIVAADARKDWKEAAVLLVGAESLPGVKPDYLPNYLHEKLHRIADRPEVTRELIAIKGLPEDEFEEDDPWMATGHHIPDGVRIGDYITHDKMDIIEGKLICESFLDADFAKKLLIKNPQKEELERLFGCSFTDVILWDDYEGPDRTEDI